MEGENSQDLFWKVEVMKVCYGRWKTSRSSMEGGNLQGFLWKVEVMKVYYGRRKTSSPSWKGEVLKVFNRRRKSSRPSGKGKSSRSSVEVIGAAMESGKPLIINGR